MNNAPQIDGNIISVIIVFSIIIISLIFGCLEALIISKLGWANFSKGFGYSFLSNYISGILTFLLSLVLVVVFIMFIAEVGIHAFGESLGIKNAFEPQTPVFQYVTAYLIIVPVIFFLFKRLFLRLFEIKKGWAAWIYAFVSSFLTLATVVGIPILLIRIFPFGK